MEATTSDCPSVVFIRIERGLYESEDGRWRILNDRGWWVLYDCGREVGDFRLLKQARGRAAYVEETERRERR